MDGLYSKTAGFQHELCIVFLRLNRLLSACEYEARLPAYWKCFRRIEWFLRRLLQQTLFVCSHEGWESHIADRTCPNSNTAYLQHCDFPIGAHKMWSSSTIADLPIFRFSDHVLSCGKLLCNMTITVISYIQDLCASSCMQMSFLHAINFPGISEHVQWDSLVLHLGYIVDKH